MLEELFNLLNICNHGDNAVKEFIKIIHSIYDDLPDVQMISLPSITAGYKIIVFYYFCDSMIFIICSFSHEDSGVNSNYG